MKKRMVWLLLAACILGGCSREGAGYTCISPQEAKTLIDTQENYVILDVRTQEEYDGGHIPGAILIPDTQIGELAQQMLKDRDQLILVYCRSGRRSKLAAQELADMGYTNVKEFGGILSWPYEIEYAMPCGQ